MKTEIKDELKESAPALAAIGNENNYRVPENYFEDFAGEVMSKIQLPATALPFTPPPVSYFDELAGSVLNKIKSNGTIIEDDNNEVTGELAALSPLVASIRKINVYTVPAHYFANFKVALPATEEKAKAVSLHRPVRWMRYAAAAVVTGVIAVGGIFLFNSTENDPFATNIRKILPTISREEITNYINNSPADMDIMPAAYDEDKLNVGSFAEQLLNDVSDADIQEYLKENTQSGEKDIKGI